MAHLTRRRISWCAVGLLVAVGAGCSDSGGGDDGEPALIGPDGGTVADSQGRATVEVPVGALGSSTAIVVSPVDAGSLAPLPTGLTFAGDAFAFTPHGTRFSVAVTIQIPYQGSDDALRVMRLDDESDTSWAPVAGATFESGVATVAVNGFSILAVALIDAVPETTVQVSWSGPGRVVPDAPGVDCDAQSPCTFSVSDVGLTLNAVPQGEGAGLLQWVGADCVDPECTLSLGGGEISVQARFGWALSVERLGAAQSGELQGRLTSTPPGIDVSFADFGGTPVAYFEPGTEVTLNASPSGDTAFAAWGGACAAVEGSGPCILTMNKAETVSFSVCNCEALTITLDGAGQVTPAPADLFGNSCRREGCTDAERCTLWFAAGTSVTLDATPSTRGRGWRFDTGWSGSGCTGTSSCTLVVDGAMTLTAGFDYPVSFFEDVYNGILQSDGKDCVFCHNSNPPAVGVKAAETGLLFTLEASAVRRLIVDEPALGECAIALGEPKRINEANFANSLMLRYPLPEGENDCDNHGLLSAFPSPSDESYRLLFDWIAGGCPSN